MSSNPSNLTATQKVTLLAEAAYETGHECQSFVVIEVPQFDPTNEDELDEFWQSEVVFEQTGCHCQPYRGSSSCGSWYGMTVADSDNPALIGASNEWSD